MQRYPDSLFSAVADALVAFDNNLVTVGEVKQMVHSIFVAHGFPLSEASNYFDVLTANGSFVQSAKDNDHEWDGFNSDAEADADVLRSIGWGTDEDYGFYGDSDADY